MSDYHPSIDVRKVPPADWPAALMLAFASDSQPDRTRKVAETLWKVREKQLSLDGLFGAYQQDRLTGVMWALEMPGKTVLLAPARVEAEADAQEVIEQLFRHVEQDLVDRRITMAQVLLEDDGLDDGPAFLARQFRSVTQLLYLSCPQRCFPSQPPNTELAFVRADQFAADRLERLISATYQQTLDCPTVNGRRSMPDVLDGYAATGDSGTTHWWVAQMDQRDSGCLILADHRSSDQLELVYMGVHPDFRGRQLGHQIVQFALWQARQLQRLRVLLAVDKDNRPALRHYQKVGFEPWDSRHLYLKFYDHSEPLSSADSLY